MTDMSGNSSRRSVRDDELIEAVKSHSDPVVNAAELRDDIGLTDTRINQLLNELEENGIVESKQVGSGKAWWVPTDPDETD